MVNENHPKENFYRTLDKNHNVLEIVLPLKNEYQLKFIFRMLLRLLEQSKEPLVLCVAAHDIGEYVRHYPHGKKYV